MADPFADFLRGQPVTAHPAIKPVHQTLEGQYTTLAPISTTHTPALYAQLCDPSKPSVFAYMSAGPFDSLSSFTAHITPLTTSQDPLFFTILPKTDLPGLSAGTPAGYLSLMAICTTDRSLEIGHVTLSPNLQRTTVATEAFQLLLKQSFEGLGNRRVEWKCDSLNAKSMRAAERLGFANEGLFRKHKIVRGRNRDTAWFSVTDEEWEGDVGTALEKWLEEENFDGGKQVRSLEEFRRGLGE